MKLYLLKKHALEFSTKQDISTNVFEFVEEKLPTRLIWDEPDDASSSKKKKNPMEEEVCTDMNRKINLAYMDETTTNLENLKDIWDLKITVNVSTRKHANETLNSIKLDGALFSPLYQSYAHMKPRLLITAVTYLTKGSKGYFERVKWKTVEADIDLWITGGYQALQFIRASSYKIPTNITKVSKNTTKFSCLLSIKIMMGDDYNGPTHPQYVPPISLGDLSSSTSSKKRKRGSSNSNGNDPTPSSSKSQPAASTPPNPIKLPPDLLEINRKILHDESTSDAIIVAASGTAFKCHKSFLVAHSKILKTQLECPLKYEPMDDSSNTVIRSVCMNDMSETSVKAFLAYLYYWETTEAEKYCAVAVDLMRAAKKFEIPSLIQSMKRLFLAKDIKWFTTKAIIDLFLIVQNTPGMADLRMKIAQLLKAKHDDLKNDRNFNELFVREPEAAMELFHLVFSVAS